MIVYAAEKNKFISDVKENAIHKKILAEFERRLFRKPAANEIDSWKNSMEYMFKILIDPDIPSNAGVSIEYTLPLTSKRIDFILTGQNADRRDTAVIVELKQWSDVKKTEKDGVVRTWLGKSERETSHPSYQAWTYAALIEDYNETVRNENIALQPCAYLHNLDTDTAINDPFYADHVSKAPVFISSDAKNLADFLKKHVKFGDTNNIMYRIEHGKIKPSKALADSLVSMMKGNREFLMIDDQKLVYETAVDLAHKAQKGKKQVLIVEGGPGTGKSVVAINLLVALTNREMLVQYVSKNAAPRAVYAAKLAGTMTKTKINNLFKGSGSYIESENNFFDVLVVDEAHRMNEKSGLYQNMGDNQIKEVIAASKCSIFFIDENQRVTLKDVGSKEEIERFAAHHGAVVHSLELKSQFRCNGSDGYLSWLDNSLQIRETANATLDGVDYDFRVFNSPNELRDAIFQKNTMHNKARLVAGYCWQWKSKKNPKAMDIVIEEHDFEAKWNLMEDGSLWIMGRDSVHQVGCIHTCQGLEVGYIGVIIGSDLIVRDGEIVTDGNKRARGDKSISGFKSRLKSHRISALKEADVIIKNTYRTLMTRGQKGCYIYCDDKETGEYFRKLIENAKREEQLVIGEMYPGLNLKILPEKLVKPFVNAVPLYDLKVAAGGFSEYQQAGGFDWVELPEPFTPKQGYFVVQVVGESMNKKIPNGSWCLFRADTAGSRNGKVVLVQHRSIQDGEMSGHYTVKMYNSEKNEDDAGIWRHSRITLSPNTTAYGYKDIVLVDDAATELAVIGELVAVLG